ncbi:MAG: response regulator [Dysgonamonadaceae bacterium]|nr:response regulator [Dysgonamonadaceae bacterium]
MKNHFSRKTLLFVLSLFCFYLYAGELPIYKFRQLTTLNGLPSNDIQKVYQDKSGYIWLASKNGLYQYDGYAFKVFKSNLHHPELLSNNNIFCLEEDYKHRLWIGTSNGLNVMDKRTGKVTQINRKEFVNNPVSTLLAAKNGRLLIGADQGLYEYQYETDSCILYGRHNTGDVFPETAVKFLMEDSYGHIWIGTWNSGLFRYDPEKNRYYSYPKMNPGNSAHYLFEDSRKRIWIGTWGGGLQLLKNAYDMDNVSWTTWQNQPDNPNSLLSNIIYGITEDLNSQKIWVGTNAGLSVLTDEKNGVFENYLPGNSEYTLSNNEVNSLLRDAQGVIWLGLLNGGVNTVSPRKPYFSSWTFDTIKYKMNLRSASSLYIDNDGIIWLGIGGNGFLQFNRTTHTFKHISEIKDFSSLSWFPAILCITKLLSNGQLWMGTYNDGLYAYDKNGKDGQKITIYTPSSVPWLPGGRVYAIYEDHNANRWLGTNAGITRITPRFEYLRFDSLECEGKKLHSAVIVDIKAGEKDEIWAASSNNGIYRIYGKGENLAGYTVSNYSLSNAKLNSVIASCIYQDRKGRIWAGTDGGGLNLYDRKTDAFIPVHLHWNLQGDAIFSILEDNAGNLWMGTNAGLMKLDVRDDLRTISYRLYTTFDGLLDNSFVRNVVFKAPDGEMFFGGHQGINSFYPEQLNEDLSFQPPVVITDIKIHNRSWSELDAQMRENISSGITPEYTRKIRLNYKNNNFNIEFASLGYETPGQYTYAYQLEGFDTQWKHTNAFARFAYYNNLKSGNYLFKLKSTNANGVWNDKVLTLEVVILPPPWKTWWAYSLYLLFILTIAVLVYRILNNRIKLKNTLQLREIEKNKAEEVNHAKLQFFTNITHELLTPLTIISAAVDDLKMQMPQYTKQYRIIANNINRLIRLLQQILEFRKAETGNLKLKVSQSDLATFISNSVESFQPLIKKKQMNFAVICNPNPFPAYFDPDKLDKILYNLLSNASKYSKQGGNITVELSEDKTANCATITIADDGMGISKDAQKDLFKRFYEGDYRKYKTIGTGIGLSLTKDLVTLHGGKIHLDSEEGKGTLCKITLPVNRSAYKEDEIDDTLIETEEIKIENNDGSEDEGIEEYESRHKNNLLLVEDNEDLMQLMVKLLAVDYIIYTAANGQEGLDVVKKEEIDLIISDVMMPVMDGIEFCKKIKSEFETSHIPVLLLTAKTGETDRIDAYEAGADSYLHKPFNLRVLHARINNLLKTRERLNKDFKKQLVFEAKELNYSTIDEDFIQKAIDCVYNNLNNPQYDQAQFAKDMGTSRSALFRKMKSLTGLSYVSFIRNVRLKAACRIMEEKKNIRISELAYAVGFSDPRYFSSCFKKEFGMQPREYFEKFSLNKDKENNEFEPEEEV